MNKIILCGRLTHDPELKDATNGEVVANFSIAVPRNNSKEEVDFFNCVAWKTTAEFIGKWFTKGKPIMIDGRVQMRSYTNREGVKKNITEVIVNNAEFVIGVPRDGKDDIKTTKTVRKLPKRKYEEELDILDEE